MNRRIRVLLYREAPPEDPSKVEDIYHQISKEVHEAPGLLRSELLRSVTESSGYVVLSEWESMEAYQAWVVSPLHESKAPALRPYVDHTRDKQFEVYEVIAAY
jgi:heme oxygenase (mycobilin-producing)